MIAKNRNVRASKVSVEKASSSLKSHLKYIQYRARDPVMESKEDRYLFSQESDHIDRREAHDVLMKERVGDIYYHSLILSPAPDEPVTDWQTWTREVMHDVEDYQGLNLTWYASHHHNTDHPHVHVIIQGTGEHQETGQAERVSFTSSDFQVLRESGRAHSGYEHYHLITDTFREMNEREAFLEAMPDHHQSEQTHPMIER